MVSKLDLWTGEHSYFFQGTVDTAYNAVVGTLKRSRYNPDRSVRGPGGGGGHGAAAVGVGGAVMVLVLKSLMRGIRGWLYCFCNTLGSPCIILVTLKCTWYGESGILEFSNWVGAMGAYFELVVSLDLISNQFNSSGHTISEIILTTMHALLLP